MTDIQSGNSLDTNGLYVWHRIGKRGKKKADNMNNTRKFIMNYAAESSDTVYFYNIDPRIAWKINRWIPVLVIRKHSFNTSGKKKNLVQQNCGIFSNNFLLFS